MSKIYNVEKHITNKLEPECKAKYVAGIIGSNPSVSARSPKVWNRVFSELEMNCFYFSFDVASKEKLKPLLMELRSVDNLLGFNVTVPYKADIIEHLDEVDPKAAAIGAVNTVVRTSAGKLIGYNTDGQGAIDNILLTQSGKDKPLMTTLSGNSVLLLGAGGAAKASAFFLADELGDNGSLTIANRERSHAQSLATSVNAYKPSLKVNIISEESVCEMAPLYDLIFNATSKGQGGILSKDGKAIYLEPYSALAPAHAPSVQRGAQSAEMFCSQYVKNAVDSIMKNNFESLSCAASIPTRVVFVDAVHTPKESVFLLHARLTGHQTLNGVGMNVGQAIDGFFEKIMKPLLIEKGWHTQAMRERIKSIMAA